MRGYKCEKCEHTASRRSSLVQHVERVHANREAGRSDGSGDDSCDNSWTQKTPKKKNIKDVKKFSCDKCDFASVWRVSLHEHVESVHERKNVYRCESCKYTSMWPRNVTKHFNNVHEKVKNHKCGNCDYVSAFRADLNKHMSRKHGTVLGQKCKVCPYTSVGKSAVKRHFEKVHVSQDGISPKAIKSLAVKEEVKIQDNSGSHEATSESQLEGIVEQFKSGKLKTEDAQTMFEHMVAAEGHVKGFSKESEVVKDTTPSDSKPEEKESKHDELKNVSSKGITIAQHKRSREDRQNSEEESERVSQVCKSDIKDYRRVPPTQSNMFSEYGVNYCAIQISLESLGLFRGVIPSQTSKCV